jgi:hypothetical protein
MKSNAIYIALPVSDTFFEKKELVSLFVSGSPEYLTQFACQNTTFWGKKIETPINLDALALGGENLLSLISKVYPSHQLKIDDIRIFPDPNLVVLQGAECRI